MLRIGRVVGVAIGWVALVGCEQASVAPREGEPPPMCAGPEGASCPLGQVCIDMPDDGCDPQAGGVDCDGICVAGQCAGILGLPCAGGLQCVDDPDDDCDPEGYGSDCPGICVEPDPSPQEEDPRVSGGQETTDPCAKAGRVYVGTDPRSCAAGFECGRSLVPFDDACGCGCEPA